MSRMLVTGVSGFLGGTLCRLAGEAGWQVRGTYFSRPVESSAGVRTVRLDLKDGSQAAGLIDRIRPEVVVHTAYSQKDREVTFQGTRRLAEACASLEEKPYFIFISTDLIFDGKKGNYCEEDTPVPVLPYGRDKLEAEKAVRGTLAGSLVVRTSLMYDFARVPGHLRFAVEAIRDGRDCTFFRDEFRSPVLVDELAGALLELARMRPEGTLHLAGRDRLERFSFGRALLAALGFSTGAVVAGSLEELGESRPADCSLDSSRAEGLLNLSFRGARETLGI
ncbi:MAG: SDR family oxidoreductase [Candidatus Glassbacteria bacterium]|nr:SDR family oxidoreductase [Candidatus Glassbacteria bacterium]